VAAAARPDERNGRALAAGEWRARSGEDLAPAGERHRLAANIAALEVLRSLEDAGRPPTAEEQAALARWSAWGSLPKVFDPDAAEFADARAQVQDLLGEDEWRAAARTTLNAHYTDFDVASAMWRAVEAVGFAGGRVLEPGVGSGTFLATAPAHLAIEAVGVEIDPVTARIAAALHPRASIRAESFAVTRFPDGWFDLSIGNVPFGDYKLFDPIYNRAGHSVHNHFIAKSLRLTRPGGYVAVLTSRFTLDARSSAARRDLAELADLVGAVRLPEGTMQRVAGTGVAMDLVVLRRREPGSPVRGEAWQRLATLATPDGPVEVNELFAAHPDWVLGELGSGHGQYGQDDLEVRPFPGPLMPLLEAALADVVGGAKRSGLSLSAPPTASSAIGGAGQVVVSDARRGPHHVERSLLRTESGRFAIVKDGLTMAYEPVRAQADELALLIELRDTYFELLDAQSASAGNDAAWAESRQRLNKLYDRYHSTYGPISRYSESPTGRYDEDGEPVMARRFSAKGGFQKDPGLPALRSLEHYDDETKTATKAAIFERRVLSPRRVVEAAERPEDALAVCLDERGSVELATVARLLGCDQPEARQRLGTLVYDDPEGEAPLPAAQYLSGDVRTRLAIAMQAAAGDERWQVNVEALQAVQPRDLGPAEIDARLGVPWIPTADIEAFCAEVLDADVTVEYTAVTGEWAVRANSSAWSIALTSEWGTERANAVRLVEANANQRVVTITDEGPAGGRVTNLAETLAAREKQEALAERFGQWVWEDKERSSRLAAEYNRRFNSVVLPTYDGSHLSFPGLAQDFRPHQHQRDAVWRALSEPSTLLAHGVGAGKTATMVMAGAELKRLGLIDKPAYVVPNHMLEQFSRELLQLYPQAKVLIASRDDVSPAQRKEFVARCAAEDWDAVVLTMSSFERIAVSARTEAGFIDNRIAELRQAIAASRTDGAGLSVKHLEKTLAREEERHKALVADVRRDEGGVNFEATGIDYLFVDEAHNYKNLAFSSHIQGVGGPGSKRAEDLAMKMGYLRQSHGARVTTFATATPIANSIAEMYTMQRYLQPDELARAGIEHFDGWAANFGRTVTALELAPDASTYRMQTRFARFANVPDLLRLFGAVADVRTGTDLALAVPELAGGKARTVVVPATPELAGYVASLAGRAERIRNRAVSPEEDNMLKVSTDGRKAALDLRLVGLAPAPDGGKIAAAADEVARIYARTASHIYLDTDGGVAPRPGALQLVFCDLGTPHGDGRWSVYDQLRAELVARGLPAESVRFMHEARNDAEKARLFAAARAGSVSVLIGSTEKMGVGTNVQARAVALHHLDCPWRPADLEQRDGRIVRQGNQNPEVEVIRYVTEASFDVFSWQTVERKAAFINQVTKGQVTERSVDDVGDQALSYAEVKALATGNPLIMERAGVSSELTKLSRLQAAHLDEQVRLARRAESSEREAAEAAKLAQAYRAAAARAIDTSGERFAMVVAGRPYRQRTEAGAALREALLAAAQATATGARRRVDLGQLGGFSVYATVSAEPGETSVVLHLGDVPRQSPTLSAEQVGELAPVGLVARLENLAGDLSPRADKEGERAAQAGAEGAKAVARTGQAFEHTGRIESLKARLVAIDAELTKADEVPEGAPVGAEAPATGIGALMDATYPVGPATVVRAPGPSEYRPVTVPDLEQPAQFER
jgi:N12 class adenine-specific DNA methylase